MNPIDSTPTRSGFREVEPAVAEQHRGELRIVDVREPSEYNGPLGHIDGSELVPLGTIATAAATWDRARPTLLVCRSGGRSGHAASALAQMGFSSLYNMSGGMMAWNAEGLPVRRD